MKNICFMLILALQPLVVSAEMKCNTYIDGIYYILNSTEKTATVSYECYDEETCRWYSSYEGNVVIPREVTYKGEKYSVTSIGSQAFYVCKDMTSLTIPSSVTSIDEWAMIGCTGLISIRVESGNPKYDSRNNCNALIETGTNTLLKGSMNTTIPNTVTAIGSDAFSGLKSITSITIPGSVLTIGNSAFSQCTNLSSVTIKNGVKDIGQGVFTFCYKLTSITIPKSVTNIQRNSFTGCYNLSSITVEKGNPKYDSRNNCNAIIETESTTLITGCKNTIIPHSVTSIGGSAFMGLNSLTSITIPEGVTCLYDYAFDQCSRLTSISIPNSITTMGYDALGSAWYLKQPDGIVYAGKVLYGYKGTMAENTRITIPEGTLGIARGAFADCEGLVSVTIPSSVVSVGGKSFSWIIGNGVMTVVSGPAAFSGCVNLASICVLNSAPPLIVIRFLLFLMI